MGPLFGSGLRLLARVTPSFPLRSSALLVVFVRRARYETGMECLATPPQTNRRKVFFIDVQSHWCEYDSMIV